MFPGMMDSASQVEQLYFRAEYLATKFEQTGARSHIDEAIALDRQALALCPPGYPMRPVILAWISTHIHDRFKNFGDMKDLDEAISLGRDALALCPREHPDHAKYLINLAVDLSARYNPSRGITDLDEAIVYGHEALKYCEPGHQDYSKCLHNLAVDVFTRYIQLGEICDLDEAIVLGQEALALHPQGHPDRSSSLDNLAYYIHVRFVQSKQSEDKEEIFGLYTEMMFVTETAVSSADLFAAGEWIRLAENFKHPTILLAYETSLRLLLHHPATFFSSPQRPNTVKNLMESLAVNAFSACLRNHSPMKAVEFLEQGRGIFWSQRSRLRCTLDNVIAAAPGREGKTLVDKFTRLASLIRNALDSPDTEILACDLIVDLHKVVLNIRELPGVSRFLLPWLFPDLRQAAREGPVIILNACKYSCDALIVLSDQDPVHIPLKVTRDRIQELSLQLRTVTTLAKTMDGGRQLAIILRELWDQVVSAIVAFLLTIYPSQSRIWWCPTAEFSVLPLHIAGPYRKGQLNLADIYISSYTPTLTALIHARRREPSSVATQGKHFIVVGPALGQAVGGYFMPGHSTNSELATIGQRVDGFAIFTDIAGSDACISQVAEELNKNEWVHFACNSILNHKQPFESAFGLTDGHFTIKHVIRCEPRNPQFAFLATCHSAVGGGESLDEMIHLAAAVHFVGFRSIIGTMWAVDDNEATKITSLFYENMLVDSSSGLDHTRAAHAIHKTLKTLRGVPLDQRVNYIHIGA